MVPPRGIDDGADELGIDDGRDRVDAGQAVVDGDAAAIVDEPAVAADWLPQGMCKDGRSTFSPLDCTSHF